MRSLLRRYFLTALCVSRRCLWSLPSYLEDWRILRPLAKWRTFAEAGLLFEVPPYPPLECLDKPTAAKVNAAVSLVKSAAPPDPTDPIWASLSVDQTRAVNVARSDALRQVFRRLVELNLSLRSGWGADLTATVVGFRGDQAEEVAILHKTCRNS